MILRVSGVEDRRQTDFSWWALREVRMGRGRLSWKLKRERLTVRNGQMLQRKRVLWGYEEVTCVVLTCVMVCLCFVCERVQYMHALMCVMCVLCSVWLVLDTYCKFYARLVFYTSCVYGLHVMWLNMCFVHV